MSNDPYCHLCGLDHAITSDGVCKSCADAFPIPKPQPQEQGELLCKCGCSEFYTSVTDRNPQKGICARCREDVDLTGARLVLKINQ